MPELPEVETTLRGIEPHLIHQRIQQITVRQASLRWPVDPAIKNLQQADILSLQRRAKYIVMTTSKGHLIWHLGMSGSMRIVATKTVAQKHDHIDLVLTSGKRLRYTDPRRFGACIYTLSDPLEHKLLTTLGPEPLSPAFNIDYLWSIAKQKSITIKQLIMDSHVVVGVGNIYACEALFMSGINPTIKCNRVTKKRLQTMLDSIKTILSAAILQGGTTLKDFTQSDGKPGYFKQQLKVYGRKDEACTQCNSTIKTIKQSQRSTFFCPVCQHS